MSRSQFRVAVFAVLLIVVFVGAMVSVSGAPLADDCPPNAGAYCFLLTAWATAGTLVATPNFGGGSQPPITVTVPIWSSPLTPALLALTALIAVYRAIRKFLV